MKLTDFSIQNSMLRLFLSLIVMLLTFFLILPQPPKSKKRNSEVYEDLSEDIPLITPNKPNFSFNL